MGELSNMALCDHFIVGEDSSLIGTAVSIPQDLYDVVRRRLEALAGVPCERHIGRVTDKMDESRGTGPMYYDFEGDDYLMVYGNAQIGIATTVDREGFGMIRLFTMGVRKQNLLRKEVFGVVTSSDFN